MTQKKPFTIKRSDVLKMVGGCTLIAVFDEAAKRQDAKDGILRYPDGWQDSDTARVLGRSPRALWLMAKAGLIPISESAALRTIVDSGRRIEPVRHPVARVRAVKATHPAVLAMRAMGLRGMASGRRPKDIPDAPLPDEFDSRPV